MRKAAATTTLRWVAFYGQTQDEAAFAGFEIVILDPGFKGSLETIAGAGARTYGYLSLGEVAATSPHFHLLAPETRLGSSISWNGSFMIDVRAKSWRSLVLDQLVPDIIARGFAGLMLDTLDTPAFLEQQDPKLNFGMRRAAVDLVLAIRSRYPSVRLIMNRGYLLLPELASILDAVIAESLLTRHQPGADAAVWLSAREVADQLALLAPATRERHALPILSLDYWTADDPATIAEIYRRERNLGHHPYVATHLLNRIIHEPCATSC
ncbi:MAG: endo alpha-1,4 polygalactosaminidase [Proteobacteria bacterium]|nr:endo alpha-1,4 polygalactosaminidase [Pseudomonadota bacterium]